jgi:hypothetical protein
MRKERAFAGHRVDGRSVVRQSVPVDRATVAAGEQGRAGGGDEGTRQHERVLYARPASLKSIAFAATVDVTHRFTSLCDLLAMLWLRPKVKMDELEEARQIAGGERASRTIGPPASQDPTVERLKAETDPIRVFQREHEWLVDYGSYAHGYHPTRSQAVAAGEAAARDEGRKLLISAAGKERGNQSRRLALKV